MLQIVETTKPTQIRLSESFLAPYRGKGDPFKSLLSRSTYLTKYCRGNVETWTDTILRVVEGNVCLARGVTQREAEMLFHLFWTGQALPPGRGLWTGGVEGIPADARYNCWATTLYGVDDWCWVANQLMLGGGVGVGLGAIDSLPVVLDNNARFGVYCDGNHKDIDEVNPEGPSFLNGHTPLYRCEDSREGWVESLRLVLEAAFAGHDLIIDVSAVRPRGEPIKTFGGVACGPGPLVNLLRATWNILRGARGRTPSSIECLDITNHIGLCIKSGNVRRSALIVLGSPTDQDFRDAKKDWEAVASHRHTSNNTIAFRTQSEIDNFDWHSLVEDNIMFGEPGLLNLPLIQKTDPGATGINPCFSGDTLIAVADGRNAVSIKQLADEGRDVPVYSMDKKTGLVEIKTGRHPRVTGEGQKLLRVHLDDGGHLDVTPNHTFVLRDGTQLEAKDLEPGMSLPRFTKALEPVKTGSKDYYRIYCDALDSSREKIFEHRLIAKFHHPIKWANMYDTCKDSGFTRTGGLVVHHKDYNPLNNSPENLEVMTFKEHTKFHAEHDTAGEKNGRFSGYSDQDIKDEALTLTRQLGRRFSKKDWHAHAESKGLPKTFSEFRQGLWKNPVELSKLCAVELGFEHVDEDPRVVATYQSMLEQGYNAQILDGKVLVGKTCEWCSHDFYVHHAQREHSFCSEACGNAYVNSNAQVKAQRIAGMDRVYSSRQEKVRLDQVRICSNLKFKLGRKPIRKEWSVACKAEGVASRIGPTLKHGFKSFPEVLEACENYNHRITRVEEIPGEHTVYNITVDDFHTLAVVSSTREKRGNLSYTGVYVPQCGEIPLHDREACNLAEVFPAQFHKNTDPHQAFRLLTRYSLRQRMTPLLDAKADAVREKNMRVGVGLGGLCDFDWTPETLSEWYGTVRKEADDYADELHVNRPNAVTTVKPSGCRPWYALTATNKGLLTLEELFQDHPEGQEWADAPEGYFALQGPNRSKITKTYDNGVAPVFRIRLACGLEVESTGNHQWFTRGHHDHVMKEDPRWVRSDQIRLGDVLDVELGAYTKEGGVLLRKVNSLALKMRGDAVAIQQPDQMTPDLAWLLGYLWGDGTLSPSKYRMRFVDEHLDNLEKAQTVLMSQFGLESKIHPASEGRNASILEVGSKMLWHWLIKNDLFKYYSNSLDLIPTAVRASGQEEVIAFIAGLLDADGGAYGPSQKTKFTVCTSDADFARHLQSVCWSVGLGVGRSHNTEGQNFQVRKSMWILTSNHFLTDKALTLLTKYSVKCAKIDPASWYSRNQKGPRRVLGKVEGIELLGDTPTYDIEVEGTHWYYAGSVKSHNTISLLNGSSPGIHAPHSPYYIRRTRIAKNDPMAQAMIDARVPHEEDAYDKSGHTWVFSFPTEAPHGKVSKTTQTVRDQFQRQADVQEYWADNAVSATLNFNPESDKEELAACLKEFVPRLKSTSCLADAHGYVQAPYEEISESEYKAMASLIDHDSQLVNAGDVESIQTDECQNGVCPIR